MKLLVVTKEGDRVALFKHATEYADCIEDLRTGEVVVYLGETVSPGNRTKPYSRPTDYEWRLVMSPTGAVGWLAAGSKYNDIAYLRDHI
jgi:hypothetical protein